MIYVGFYSSLVFLDMMRLRMLIGNASFVKYARNTTLNLSEIRSLTKL